MKAKPQLGRTYKDVITGFEGVMTGRAEYISGCNQCLLAPKVDPSTGASREGVWIDEQRLVDTNADQIKLDNGTTPGCDRQAPIR